MLSQQSLDDCEHALNSFQDQQKEHKKNNVAIFDDTIKKIESSFLPLGLTEEQEEEILRILTEGVELSLTYFEAGAEMDNDLKKIVSQLQALKI